MYHVSAQGVEERVINVHYYYDYVKIQKNALNNLGVSLRIKIFNNNAGAKYNRISCEKCDHCLAVGKI